MTKIQIVSLPKPTPEPTPNTSRLSSWTSSLRRTTYHWLFDPHGRHQYAKTIEKWLAALIITNIIILPFELIQTIYEPYAKWFHLFDIVSIAIFTIEYLLRLWPAPMM